MKSHRLGLAALVVLVAAACDFDVPNLNQPAIESLQKPTPSQVNALATGLLIGARKGATERVGFVTEWGVLGREAVVLTPSEPRFINALLGPSLSNGDANFGGNFWVIPYSNIRAANLLLHAVDSSALVGFTDAQKQAVRGFAKTIQALDYLQVVDAHDTNGVVLDVDHPLGDPPAPIVTSLDTAYTFIEGLLDSAQGSLAAGGDSFPFKLGSGFAGLDTPATFKKFNRALRARVAVYHGKYPEALTALSASFLDPDAPLSVGASHAFGAGSGDTPNDLNDTSIFAHNSVVIDAEPLPGGGGGGGCAGAPPLPLQCLDRRVQAKVAPLASPFTLTNHSSAYALTLYPSSVSPIPIIRNEELILLRAEANIGLGNLNSGGGPSALSDLNFIRTQSGGLRPRGPFASAAEAIDELLNQRRYSLLFEGGHRWIDLRRYGKLDPAHVTVDPGDVIHPAFPIPLTETQARGG